MIIIKKITLFTTIFLVFTCQMERDEVIPNEVKSFVDSFFLDAQLHGLDINRSEIGLLIEFADIDQLLVDGQCNRSENKITIDSFFWNFSTESEKKWLVYHELGHCVLERAHDNSSFVNGECKTIMHGDFAGRDCSSNFVSDSWSEYYIEELFTFSDKEPEWYSLDTSYQSVIDKGCFILDTILNEDRLRFDFKPDVTIEDFQIEILVQGRTNIEGSIFFLWNDAFSYRVWSKNVLDIKKSLSIGQLNLTETLFRKEIIEDLRENMKISLRKQNGYFYFYVDETLHHMIDSEQMESTRISFISIVDKVDLQFQFCLLE